MDVKGTSQDCTKIDVEALAVPVFKDEKADKGILKTLDKAVDGLIRSVLKSEEFAGKEGETAYFHVAGNGLKARRLLLIGCGERSEYKSRQLSQMAATAARFLRSKNAKTLAVIPRADGPAQLVEQNAVTGAIMGLFEPDKYRTKDKETREIKALTITIEGADKRELQSGVERGRIIGESVNFTREQANEPGGHLTPTVLADRAKSVAKQFRLEFDA